MRELRIPAQKLAATKKIIQEMITQLNKKPKHLIDVSRKGGIACNRSDYLVKQIDDPWGQSERLRDKMEAMLFDVHILATSYWAPTAKI